MDDVILAHDLQGLVFWPAEDVAAIRAEHAGRLEVVHRDGSVAHRPGPLEAWSGSPFMAAGSGVLLNPANVEWESGGARLPGGRIVEGVRRPRRVAGRVPELVVPELGVRPSEVLYVQALVGRSHIVTDRGVVEAPEGLLGKEVAALIPGLVRATRDWHVNPRRLKRVRPEPRQAFVLEFDDGRTEIRLWHAGTKTFQQALGLESLRHAGYANAGQRVLHREGLRDWDFVLADAPAETLRSLFGSDERRMLGNLVLQGYLAEQEGWPVTWGRPHRGFYYRPVLPVLRRLGLLSGEPAWLARSEDDPSWMARGAVDPHYTKLCLVLTALVASGVFTYSQLGWDEPRPDMRGIGSTQPQVLLLVEKGTMEAEARWLHRELGVSFKITGGLPSFLATEYLVEALRAAGVGPLVVATLVDWDPYGAVVRDSFCEQLQHYGMEIARVVDLVRPENFTAREIEELAVPLAYGHRNHQGRLETWLEETGGIGGRALGLNADGLRPAERIAELLRTSAALGGAA